MVGVIRVIRVITAIRATRTVFSNKLLVPRGSSISLKPGVPVLVASSDGTRRARALPRSVGQVRPKSCHDSVEGKRSRSKNHVDRVESRAEIDCSGRDDVCVCAPRQEGNHHPGHAHCVRGQGGLRFGEGGSGFSFAVACLGSRSSY